MNTAALSSHSSYLMPTANIFRPLMTSMVFHTIVVAIIIVGLPHVKPTIEMENHAVTVEIMDVAETTQSNKTPESAEASKTKKKDKLDDKVRAEREVAPKMTAKAPPKPVMPEAPDENMDGFAASSETAYVPDRVPLPNIKPYRAKPKKAPKPEIAPDNKAKTAIEQEQFDSVLRNLMPDAPDQKIEKGESSYTKPDQPRLMSRFSDRLTISEQEMLRRKLSQCWKLMAGARYAEDLIVELKLFMNRDGTVRQASVMNASRYNHDSFYRAAADSALRAVTNPTCSPFGLPAEKYEAWKTIVVRFDPREVL